MQYLHRLRTRRLLRPGARLWDREERSEVEVISCTGHDRCLVRYPDGWERVVDIDTLKREG